MFTVFFRRYILVKNISHYLFATERGDKLMTIY
jgi:hypothetical protein